MIPLAILNQVVTIKRRTSTGRDSLNNPVYGAPTSGAGWNAVYNNVPCRLAFSSKPLMFAIEGERVTPTGTMYFNSGYDIQEEDRVLTADGIEYIITSIVTATTFGTVVDHYEAILQLP